MLSKRSCRIDAKKEVDFIRKNSKMSLTNNKRNYKDENYSRDNDAKN